MQRHWKNTYKDAVCKQTRFATKIFYGTVSQVPKYVILANVCDHIFTVLTPTMIAQNVNYRTNLWKFPAIQVIFQSTNERSHWIKDIIIYTSH